jgi:hypothetical protein
MIALFLTLACRDPGPDKPDDLWPFPSAHLVADGHLAIPADDLPMASGGTPFDVDRLAFRTGFSVVQTTVIDPGTALDPDSLPTLDDVGTLGSVQMWDLDSGEPILCFAELDAYPELGNEDPTLLVRPVEPMTAGHRVAVVTTSDLRTADGETFSLPWFDPLVSGHPAASLEEWEPHYTDLIDRLDAIGVSDVAFAIDFPVGDGTALLRSAVDRSAVPQRWTLDTFVDGGPFADPWLQIQGTFETTSFLDGSSFVLDERGEPIPQGSATADLYVYLPASIRYDTPGTVPVWVFGHGLLQTPGAYFEDESFLDLVGRGNAIVVATEWRGLSADDIATALSIGADFGRFPELTDMLSQGVLDTLQLSALVRDGGLLDDPALLGLGDPTQVYYVGISLGSIEGAVVQALDPSFRAAVLHVGGSTWSTMLERSSNWPVFEDLLVAGVPSAKERQLGYALSQLYWDPVDPASYATDLATRPILWQEAVGDDQVPNLTTETLMRGVGAKLLEPAVSVPFGIESTSQPMAPAWSQLDPELGMPPDVNRPAPRTGAHAVPRIWEGTKQQVLRFLQPDDPGVVAHYCGDAPCTADNTGE